MDSKNYPPLEAYGNEYDSILEVNRELNLVGRI